MDSTVLVAGLGLISTVAASGLTAYLQRREGRESRLFMVRADAYASMVVEVYEYRRATYNRVKAKQDGQPESVRAELRQTAWIANSRAAAAIARVALLSNDPEVGRKLNRIRTEIGDMNKHVVSETSPSLRATSARIAERLDDVLAQARVELHGA